MIHGKSQTKHQTELKIIRNTRINIIHKYLQNNTSANNPVSLQTNGALMTKKQIR